MTVSDHIKKMVAREFGVELSSIKDETNFRDDLGSSGYQKYVLERKCEAKFKIKFDGRTFQFKTVVELIALVEDKLAAKEKAA